LDLWPELNGLTYLQLPNKIRAGLDRRAISSIVLLKESAPDEEEAIFLRQLVFERLNTGGVKLEYGLDANSNGILDAGEINASLTKYVCNGAVGLLQNGIAAGNTPYWNGTEWVINSSNLFNNGGSIGIGTTNPNGSSILELNSTNSGLLLPRMTSLQRTAINNPATGLLVYQTDSPAGFYYYNGSSWLLLGNGTSGSDSNSLIYTVRGF
jgi:hypothetical protein